MTAFTVIDFEDGRALEDLHPTTSKARTPAGFLRLFYARWPDAPRGDFYAVTMLDDSGADIYTKTHKRVAAFRARH